MAKFAPHMSDPHGDPLTSQQHADPHGLGAFFKKTIQEIHVDRRVVDWSAGCHVDHSCGGGVKFRHGLGKTGPPTGEENTATLKIGQKYAKNTKKIGFSVFLVYFCPILLGAVFLFCRGPSFSQAMAC